MYELERLAVGAGVEACPQRRMDVDDGNAKKAWSTKSVQSRLMALAAKMATMLSDTEAWIIMTILAQRDSTGVSVGENATLVLKARNR